MTYLIVIQLLGFGNPVMAYPMASIEQCKKIVANSVGLEVSKAVNFDMSGGFISREVPERISYCTSFPK